MDILKLTEALRHAYVQITGIDFIAYIPQDKVEILELIPEEDKITQRKYIAEHVVVAIKDNEVVYSEIDLDKFMSDFQNFMDALQET